MQDPNEDTEWNDVLRAKGIIPPKEEKEITEDDIVNMLEETVQKKSAGKDMEDMGLDELDEIEDDIDEEDEQVFEAYRRQRMAEVRALQEKSRFGSVRAISKDEYVREVNNAGEGIPVILHVYEDEIPLCKIVNHHLIQLAAKFPATKFLKSVAKVCIPNYPNKNLPTIFYYKDGDLKQQMVGPMPFGGMNLTQDELEWKLSKLGAVETELEENPRPAAKDVFSSSIFSSSRKDDNDDNDW